MTTQPDQDHMPAPTTTPQLPCEEAHDQDCPNTATHRGAHKACGYGLLWCPQHIAEWLTQIAQYDYQTRKPTCAACGQPITGPDQMEARPLP